MDRARALILVVDDDVRSARKLAQMLREDGFDVEVVGDGAAAIARLSRNHLPAVLVTDLHMPSADGAAVAKYARSRKCNIPVILVTGYPHQAGRLDDLDPKPIVFTKPLVYDDLSRVIRDASREASR